MGALHEGHLSLVRAAKARCGAVAVSIFVNPTQFGPAEDLAKYPRQFERDCRLLEKEGVEILFAPPVEEIYPKSNTNDAATWVVVEGLSEKLDGRSRPGHFRGVTTIVAKLFHIVEPEAAFFGQKDAAQLAVIRRMVRDLNFPVEIVACPIVREPDGLAMSSRNVYLSGEERSRALVLQRSLQRSSAAISRRRKKRGEADLRREGSLRARAASPFGLFRDRRSRYARSRRTNLAKDAGRRRRLCRNYAADRQCCAGTVGASRVHSVNIFGICLSPTDRGTPLRQSLVLTEIFIKLTLEAFA